MIYKVFVFRMGQWEYLSSYTSEESTVNTVHAWRVLGYRVKVMKCK